MNLQSLIKSPATILIMYSMAIVSLITAVFCKLPWVMLFPILLFSIHDIVFRMKNENFKGRDAKGVNESIASASTYISYFLGFVGVFIAFLISKENNILDSIKTTPNISWFTVYAAIVIILSGVSLLFIPIQYTEKSKSKKASEALKNCFLFVLLSEKIIIILIVYLLIAGVKSIIG